MNENAADSLLTQPWPLKCAWCGKVWAKMPLVAIAMGNAPSLCPECLVKYAKMIDNPSKKGTTITFNSWKGPCT